MDNIYAKTALMLQGECLCGCCGKPVDQHDKEDMCRTLETVRGIIYIALEQEGISEQWRATLKDTLQEITTR
jgi:hypothetical protein